MRRFRKVLQLSPSDWYILGQAWFLFLFVELGLHILPFKSLLKVHRADRLKKRQPSSQTQAFSVPRLAWLVNIAGRYSFIKATCLKQALVLSWLLERRGFSTLLRIGVSRHAGALKAHAWLEQDGRIILGLHVHEHFEPLFET
ncbi:MAG: lasso peptide biosynthesis B2 protein [Nitrospirae bacterium]|nr:MAG: lasso peptide biosynthesis B2 protein [Nitrospirota bacterium]